MNSHLAILVFASILFTKCSNNTISEETVDHGDTTVQETPLEINQESITEQMRDSMGKMAFPSKEEIIKILSKQLENKNIHVANSAFLKQLRNEQSYDSITLANMFSYELALSPIYYYDGKSQIVSLFADTEFADTEYMPVFKEHNILNDAIKTKHWKYEGAPSYYDTIEYYSFLFDTLFSSHVNEVYTFNTDERSSNTIVGIGQELTDCSYMCLFPLAKKDPSLLLCSPFALELEFLINKEIDQLMNNQSKYYWGDCPSNIDQEQVFAKLKGTEGLYFTFVDGETDGAQPDWSLYPMRSLVYVNRKNKVKYLWTSDLYEQSCSCL